MAYENNLTDRTDNPPQNSATVDQTVRPNRIINTGKQNDLLYWTETTKRLQCYLAQERKYTVSEYWPTDNRILRILLAEERVVARYVDRLP